MAYNNENNLIRIFLIQEFYKKQSAKGIPNKRIWHTVVNIYPMSLRTFYNYLAINAKRELKELNINLEQLLKEKKHVIENLQEFESYTQYNR